METAGSGGRSTGVHLRLNLEPHSRRKEGFTSVGTVPGTEQALNTFPWTEAPNREIWGGPRGVAAPAVLRGLIGQAGLSSQGLRHLLLLLPSSQVKRAAAGPWTKGRQGGRQAGASRRAQGERRALSAETQPRGQGHNAGDSFGRNRHAFLSTNCCYNSLLDLMLSYFTPNK